MAVKLGRGGASRELWAVLSDLPAPALLQKTNLLRAVLDLVGAPFSQQDVGKCIYKNHSLFLGFSNMSVLICVLCRCGSSGAARADCTAVAGGAAAPV